MSNDTAFPTNQRIVELDIQGMTCASCVGRVERKLGKLEGVEALVNLPLESARVTVPEGVTDEELISTVESAGYKANLKVDQYAEQSARSQTETAQTSTAAASPEPPRKNKPAAQAGQDLKKRLIVGAIFTVPLFIISMIPGAQFPHWGWVALALATPVTFWSAWPFHRAAAINARHLSSTMDTLVSIGVLAAYFYSLWQLIADPNITAHVGMAMSEHALYFETAGVVATFLLLGRWLEARAKVRAGDALKTLLDLGAKEATLIREGVETKVSAAELIPGDEFIVRPGEKIATDGFVVSGHSAVDTALVTGESVPVEVGPDDTVTGATINTSGVLVIRATRVGKDTTLAQMGRLVSQAQTGKAPIARLADRISAVFVPIVLVIALSTFVLWLLLTGDMGSAVAAAVAVLVIACPCALGLATPIGLLVGTGRGAQLGILIRGPQVLEDTRKVDTVLLDKTGTVTEGNLAVTSTAPASGFDEEALLALAGAAESGSEHPIAQAIVEAARTKASLAAATGFVSAAGGGVRAMVGAHTVVAGRESWLKENGIELSDRQRADLATAQSNGATSIMIGVDGTFAGFVNLTDTIKESSTAAIARLKELGLRPVLLTGDNKAVAQQVAAKVGIAPEDVFADVFPEGKAQAVRQLQEQGRVVAMVGDGVNDAPALAQADLGIAMGSGTDVAIEAADVTIMGNDVEQVAQAIELSRKTLGTIKMNLFWAFLYNTAGIPVAALGFLNPMIAGAAMAASSVLVVANSLRLRGFGRT
ncbi:copper-translocating P-type ATPase [Arthrobacter sp. MYb211]|uniref:heavy metal translocating P-type ATPase n=1 Tax=unclassified Arthrobacter TaxID=235627 RepID=UPI000CFAB2E9|nr:MULTISPECIES: heavy metal translocating P-type ATPase [unclassified Arthrobacter]PRA09945.1 copper-translocating P-type ATPase [Arthrobacter sp. MYb221]PRC05026.1 copper-translocating P-type ATPase [Arthrobacter sp. MYb211]